jgi:N-acetylmuramoyl-L-alanine amidase
MNKVIVIVGHSPSDPGASNKSFGVNEFGFNSTLADAIKFRFTDLNTTADIEIVYRETNYKELPDQVNKLNPDLIVSLHCNAFNTHVGGCEMLHYHKSKKGKEIARIFQNKIVNILDNKDRGLKACDSEDRGGYLLNMTKAPCIIAEPFFIDNDDEYLDALEVMTSGKLVDGYCMAIHDSLTYLKGLSDGR